MTARFRSMSYRAHPSPFDRAKAIASVLAIYAIVGGLLLLVARSAPPSRSSNGKPTVLIDVSELPEPKPPPKEDAGKAEDDEGAAGKKAEPAPVAAPKPAIELPAKAAVAAAPIAGTGSATTAGAATIGTGPGAGGSGTGRSGGGSGRGGGIGTDARLLGGNSARLPSRLLRGFAADRGYGHLWLTISENGRATDCSVLQSTGDERVDQALCNLMIRQSRWVPARDRDGRPIPVNVRYTATWRKN